MPTLADIRQGLADNLSVIPNLQVSPYVLSSPTAPAAEIVPAEIQYDLAMSRGLDKWSLTVRVFVGTSTDKGAQVRLDQMMASDGSESVKEALESDCTLGAAVSDLQVKTCSGYRVWGDNTPLLGAEWSVEVYS